jgi:hypothetical protein
VPALQINGGGTATREQAEHDCLAAINFALQGDPRDYDTDAETITLDISVDLQPESPTGPPAIRRREAPRIVLQGRPSVPPIRTLLTTASPADGQELIPGTATKPGWTHRPKRRWPPGCRGVQPQAFGCGSPEAYWFHSCGVGGPT